jgi:hypothetical protein
MPTYAVAFAHLCGADDMFSASLYERLIQDLLQRGMKFSLDWSAVDTQNNVLLRHDIDFSVDHAHRMAVQEVRLGVRSTFFFMLTSNMYNPMSRAKQDLIKSIRDMGHKISLHFDPTAYKNLNPFRNEKRAFEDMFDIDIDIVSIHRPGPFLDNNNIDLFGVAQTYHDKYFKDMVYISDSGGRDPRPGLDSYFKGAEHKNLQLLIHPIWWGESAASPSATLNAWKAHHIEFITQEIRANCGTYVD